MKKDTDEILKNATVIYIDGSSEQFETIRLTKKGPVIGRIIDGKFITYGFIFTSNIKEIKTNGGRKS